VLLEDLELATAELHWRGSSVEQLKAYPDRLGNSAISGQRLPDCLTASMNLLGPKKRKSADPTSVEAGSFFWSPDGKP
jgi:hypothetical protein